MVKLLLKDEVYAIVGAAMEVYNQLGAGFLEPMYQEAMEIETSDREIPAKAQQEIRINFKGKKLKKFYVADLLCFDQIIVEIKALDRITSREESQLINYLKATGLQVGLLINFGSQDKLEWRRLVLTPDGSSKRPPGIIRESESEYKIRED